MMELSSEAKVYLALGATDCRKSIDGLAILVKSRFDLDPFSGRLFAFCNRRRSMVKILFWDRNGFWLIQKRLERQLFRWPRTADGVAELSARELRWLLDGLDPARLKGHASVEYSTLY